MRTFARTSIVWALGPLLVFVLYGCSLADLRTGSLKADGLTEANAQKGRQLLEQAVLAQGVDAMARHETYEVVLRDRWRGIGKFSNPWPVNGEQMRLRFAVGTFDSRADILEGKRKGYAFGMQSWREYRQTPGQPLVFLEKNDKKEAFILPAMQYFFELPNRLLQAPVVAYAGEKNWKDERYDLVFATWESPAPNKRYDQYQLWIGQTSGLVERVAFTVRDNYAPAPKSLYSTLVFSDFRERAGVQVPYRMSFYLKEPNNNADKYLHEVQVERFAFDSFDKSELYPDPNLSPTGDAKPDDATQN